MNKKDQSELKKRISDDSGLVTINNVVKAVVREKKLICQEHGSYIAKPQGEADSILDMLKKVISGKLGKTLNEYEFPNSAYETDKDHIQPLLLETVETKLNDPDVIDRLLKAICDKVQYVGTYAVLIAGCEYEVYSKETDDTEDFNFLIAAICPINVRIDGLIFDNQSKAIIKKQSFDSILDVPTDGFMFPCFTDRESDVNHVVYYCKSAAKPNVSVIEDLLECEYKLSADKQYTAFWGMTAKLADNDLKYDMIADINSQLAKIAERDPAKIGSVDYYEMHRILEQAGLSEEQLEPLNEMYKENMGRQAFAASNICEKKVSVKAENVMVSIDCKSAGKLHTKNVSGKRYLMVDLDGTEIVVNGISTYL